MNIIYQIKKKDIEKFKESIDAKNSIKKCLDNFWNDYVDDYISDKSEKGAKRILNTIMNKKNNKVVKAALKYFEKSGMDMQIVEFIKNTIIEDLSDYAADEYLTYIEWDD